MTTGITKPTIRIVTSALFDPTCREFLSNRVITVNERLGLVVDVEAYEGSGDELLELDEKTTRVIDLRGKYVLPGLVDAHVHLFLHTYSEASWRDQLTKESLVERTIRAANHAKQTLLAGFTTVRDCGTEGAEDADIHLRRCLSGPDPLIPGPRFFCSSKAIIASGSYGPKSSLHPLSDGVDGVIGASVADGVDECVKTVRQHIGSGADWVKIYPEYRVRSQLGVSHPKASTESLPTFSRAELAAMIDTAHRLEAKVAAHIMNGRTVAELVSLGVDSIEHGVGILDGGQRLTDVLRWLTVPNGVGWVPTLSVFYDYAVNRNGGAYGDEMWETLQRNFQTIIIQAQRNDLLDRLNIGVGGDTGATKHGENALELQLMVKLGAPWKYVLTWATLGNYHLIKPMRGSVEQEVGPNATRPGDNEVPFGKLDRGWAADIIASSGDFERDFAGAVDKGSIVFVMKAGKVYKENGKPVL